MEKNTFISKEISFKRILKGLAISIPCMVMMLVIGAHFLDFIDNSLREHYLVEAIVYKDNVLGVETTFEEKYATELAEQKEAYGIDEYIQNYNRNIEGYTTEFPYLRLPEFYLSGEGAGISQTWILKDGYKLELNCPETVLSEVIPGDYYQCTVKYNNKVVSDDVRYYIRWPDEGKSVGAQVSMVVYSPTEYEDSDNYEIFILGSYYSGSKDDITFYTLENGNATVMPFEYKGEITNTWTVENPMELELFSNDKGERKFLTNLHDPSMPGTGIFRIWSFGQKSFTLDRTIGDI